MLDPRLVSTPCVPPRKAAVMPSRASRREGPVQSTGSQYQCPYFMHPRSFGLQPRWRSVGRVSLSCHNCYPIEERQISVISKQEYLVVATECHTGTSLSFWWPEKGTYKLPHLRSRLFILQNRYLGFVGSVSEPRWSRNQDRQLSRVCSSACQHVLCLTIESPKCMAKT
jgi:hypothetical protein